MKAHPVRLRIGMRSVPVTDGGFRRSSQRRGLLHDWVTLDLWCQPRADERPATGIGAGQELVEAARGSRRTDSPVRTRVLLRGVIRHTSRVQPSFYGCVVASVEDVAYRRRHTGQQVVKASAPPTVVEEARGGQLNLVALSLISTPSVRPARSVGPS